MKELSLHILDIAENSVRAKAQKIEITIVEDRKRDVLTIEITDNGYGMDELTLKNAINPFFSTKDVRRIGMGLSLLKNAAERANGHMKIISEPGRGTQVLVSFQYSHFDRQPLGDIASTITILIMGSPDIRIVLKHVIDTNIFIFDTDEIKSVLDGVPIQNREVIQFISDVIRDRKNLMD
jgi:anti-sigma regulatory factor (Ser/Thr protein kinase)